MDTISGVKNNDNKKPKDVYSEARVGRGQGNEEWERRGRDMGGLSYVSGGYTKQ
jgi:hypothetical protein